MMQGSPEWFAARCGHVTASRIADMMAKTKTGWGASRANYRAELIAERLTGCPAQSYTNAAMQWGIETEPQAVAAYEFFTGRDVEETGFILHPTIQLTGASPDRLVPEAGCLEVKCPNTATHIEYLLGGVAPSKYLDQMQWQMDCAERQWCDFVSFDPRMPEDLRFFCVRVPRDDARIAVLRQAVTEFLGEIDTMTAKLSALALRKAAA